MSEGTLPFTNADRTRALAGFVEPRNKKTRTQNQNIMKTNTNPNSSVDHTQASPAEREAQFPIKPAWRKKLAWSLGIPLTLALAVLFSHQAKSNDDHGRRGQGLEGSWINTVSPILPPGSPPISFQTYITFSEGGGSIGSDRTRPFGSPQHGTWVHVRGHEYAWTFVQDLFDQAGIFPGTLKGRTLVQLVGKDELVGVANVEQRDPAGNIVINRCARFHAVRVVVEPLAPPCEELEPGM
jgi:hypothetical protein